MFKHRFKSYCEAWFYLLFLFHSQVIHDILPQLAKQKVNSLIQFAQNAQYNLESKPQSTMEYVESLTFLDEIQDKIDEKEKNADIAKQLYDLIEQYSVPTPPEDLAVYQVSLKIK